MREELRILTGGALLVLIALAGSTVTAAPGRQAAVHDHQAAASPVPQAAPAVPQRMDMMARAAAMDAQLKTLTDEMNKATGQAKIDAMARLLTALVEERSMMMQQMKMMQGGMEGATRAPADAK